MDNKEWSFVGDMFHEKVVGIFADWYEYKGQYARIRVWARTQTQAKVRIGKYETYSKNEIVPNDFRWKKKAVENFFQALVGKPIFFRQLEKVITYPNSEGAMILVAVNLPADFRLTPHDIARMQVCK